jgi:hypothetical protein
MSHLHIESETPVRASDAEREQAAELLRAGYGDGRLTLDELDERLAAGYAAKTRADLRSLTSDLPGTAAAVLPATGRCPRTCPSSARNRARACGPTGACCACWSLSRPPGSPTGSSPPAVGHGRPSRAGPRCLAPPQGDDADGAAKAPEIPSASPLCLLATGRLLGRLVPPTR